MKTLISVLATLIITTNVNASVLQMCTSIANEVCKELERRDYVKCHVFELEQCLKVDSKSLNKSIQYCEEYCLSLPETTMREICLEQCNAMD